MKFVRSSVVSMVVAGSMACAVAPPAQSPTGGPTEGASGAGAQTVATKRDPKIQALADKALTCKYEDGDFDGECEAYKAWDDEEDAFEDGKGDETLLSMAEDKDERVRKLGSRHRLSDAFLAQPAVIQRLVAQFKRENDVQMKRDLISVIAKIPADKPGVVAAWNELAGNQDPEMRHTLGFYMSQKSPDALAVSMKLVNDKELKVRDGAIHGIGMATDFGRNEAACSALVTLLGREDDAEGNLQWSASTTSCKNVAEPLVESLVKRSAEPARMESSSGHYAFAVDELCGSSSSATPEQRKKLFEVAKRLTAPTLKYRSRSAVVALAKCDPVQGKALLTKLTNDKDTSVARSAKEALASLAKAASKAKTK